MNPVHIVLAISLAFNALLGWAYLGKRDEAVTHEVREQQATGVAMKCSEGTEKLETKAAQREEEAGPARKAAADKDRQHQVKAQQILSTPPAVPGDTCASAQAVVDDWWAGRAKP